MQQLDHLDQECEQLKSHLADREEDTFVLQEQVKSLKDEQEQIREQMKAQQVGGRVWEGGL